MADDELKIVRIHVGIEQEGDMAVARVFYMDADASPGRIALCAPIEILELPGIGDAFVNLASQIASRLGVEMGKAGGEIAVSLPVPRGASDDVGDLEFEVQFGELDGKLCAFLANLEGECSPNPASHEALAAIPLAFAGDEGVQSAFHALVQAIGIALVRTQVEERCEKGAPGTH